MLNLIISDDIMLKLGYIVAKIGRNENIITEMIVRLFNLLDCDISEVMQL